MQRPTTKRAHFVPAVGHAVEAWAAGVGGLVGSLGSMLANAGVGIAAGAVVLAVVEGVKRLWGRR